MTPPRLIDVAALPGRLAVSPSEAAIALGVSLTYFSENVVAELRVIRHGRRVIIPVAELVHWMEREGEAVAATIGASR